MFTRHTIPISLGALLALLPACVFAELPLDELACDPNRPCAEGFVCVDARCLSGLPFDGGRDRARIDTGPGVDTRPRDARMDGGVAQDGDVGVDGAEDTGGADSGADTGTDAGAPGCEDEWLLCENFDSPLTGWRLGSDGRDPLIDTVRAHRGPSSLQVEVGQGIHRASIGKRISPVGSGTLYTRFYIYLPVTVVGLTTFSVHETSAPFRGVAISLKTGLIFSGVADGSHRLGTTAIPLNEWVCITQEIELDDAGRVDVSINGDLEVRRDPADTRPAEPVGNVAMGVLFRSAVDDQPTFRFWIDSVAVSRTPIACSD